MEEIQYFQIQRVVVPFTYYVFSGVTGNGYVSMTLNGTAITWAAGNYTPTQWIAAIASQLPSGFSIVYNAVNGKLVFSYSSNVVISFAATEYAWQWLGLNSGTTTTGVTTYTAPNVAQFSGPNYVYLRSNLASVWNNDKMFYSRSIKDGSGDILMQIPITSNSGGVTDYQDVSQKFFRFTNSTTRQLDFYFTLGDLTTQGPDSPLAFNGVPFVVKLHGYDFPKATGINANYKQGII